MYVSRNLHVHLYIRCNLCLLGVPGIELGMDIGGTVVNTNCKMLSECSFKGVITQLSNHFVTMVYKMILKKDPPYM